MQLKSYTMNQPVKGLDSDILHGNDGSLGDDEEGEEYVSD